MKQSKNKLLLALLAAVIVLGLAVGAIMLHQSNQNTSEPADSSQQSSESAVNELGRTEISYEATPGITSLEQLRSEAEDVITQDTEYGDLVDSIEGHKGGTDGKYWSFYVNGVMAQVGASAYVQEEGDVIEWKFQKL